MAIVAATTLKTHGHQDEDDLLEDIRRDLEDALKEYSELDLLVELLQNSLDALDHRRFIEICDILGVNHQDECVIEKWNAAVIELMREDCVEFQAKPDDLSRAIWHRAATNSVERRRAWWKSLSQSFDKASSGAELLDYAPSWPSLRIQFELSSGINYLTVEDAGVGISDILRAFKHKSGMKRPAPNVAKRLGIRGGHGWGLSAILALSDGVEIATRSPDGGWRGAIFSSFASFMRAMGTPTIETLSPSDDSDLERLTALCPRLASEAERGTLIRVRLGELSDHSLFGNTVHSASLRRLSNLLRLYTPIGQINDYVAHPAFHTFRLGDFAPRLRVVQDGQPAQEADVPLAYLTLGEMKPSVCQSLPDYVQTGQKPEMSVYTLGRTLTEPNVFLTAAEIQPAKPVLEAIEKEQEEVLPHFLDDANREIATLPRGMYLALSGGMRSEYVALEPKSSSAAYRGIVLAETARPTLGRKYTLDQRTAIPAAARRHATIYENIRRMVVAQGQPVLLGPAGHRWRRQLWDDLKSALELESPPCSSLRIWGSAKSGEARVMLTFADLAQQGTFGDIRILHSHLRDIYDFQFLYRWNAGVVGGPLPSRSNALVQEGWADPVGNGFRRWGIGEFKNDGAAVLGELTPGSSDWRKNPDSIDLLVCWSFNPALVASAGWISDSVSDLNCEFEGQTHVWRATSPEITRTRALPVVALKDLIEQRLAGGVFEQVAGGWDGAVGDNYY